MGGKSDPSVGGGPLTQVTGRVMSVNDSAFVFEGRCLRVCPAQPEKAVCLRRGDRYHDCVRRTCRCREHFRIVGIEAKKNPFGVNQCSISKGRSARLRHRSSPCAGGLETRLTCQRRTCFRVRRRFSPGHTAGSTSLSVCWVKLLDFDSEQNLIR
ncbi:hypothetical protein HED48_12850 [Ochrobactrum intermedium]|nr:hypothetical protein [Brucella intermedia]